MRSVLSVSRQLVCGVMLFVVASGIQAQTVDDRIYPSSAQTGASQPQATAWVVLSPRMPYALAEWPRMRGLAERAGFAIQPFRDPRVTEEEWTRAIHAVGLTELFGIHVMSAEVASQYGLLNHAPATLVLRCGQMHPWPILGVMPDKAWIEVLRARADGLKGWAC